MSLRLSGHLKEDGIPCGSSALRGQRHCYFHLDPDSSRLMAAWARAIITGRFAKAREGAFSWRS